MGIYYTRQCPFGELFDNGLSRKKTRTHTGEDFWISVLILLNRQQWRRWDEQAAQFMNIPTQSGGRCSSNVNGALSDATRRPSPWDWHCVSCNCPEWVSVVSASAGGDISSQGQREGTDLQTNRGPVSQTPSAGRSSISHTSLARPEEKTTGLEPAQNYRVTNTHTHTFKKGVRETERPWPVHSPRKAPNAKALNKYSLQRNDSSTLWNKHIVAIPGLTINPSQICNLFGTS